MVYFSKAFSDTPPDVSDYKSGVYAMIATYLGYCALQGPSSLMVRPHPVVWRLVHGCAMVYLMALAFLLMQGKTETRLWLKVRPSLYHAKHFEHPVPHSSLCWASQRPASGSKCAPLCHAKHFEHPFPYLLRVWYYMQTVVPVTLHFQIWYLDCQVHRT